MEERRPVIAYPGWTLNIYYVRDRVQGNYFEGVLTGPDGEEIRMRPTTFKPYLVINAAYYIDGFFTPYPPLN